MPPDDNVRPWIMLTGASLSVTDVSAFGDIRFAIKDPSNPKLYWGGVAAEYGGLVKFMNKERRDINKAAADITAGASTPVEKLQEISEVCQAKIKKTTFETSITDEARTKIK